MQNKTLIVLTLLLVLFSLSYSEDIICKDATPGGLYIVGPDISSDSLPGNFLYYSADYGSTLVLKDVDTTGYIKFAHITADSTVGGVYQSTTGWGLYYSSDFGESWSFQSGDAYIDISSGRIPGEIYKGRGKYSTDYGVNWESHGASGATGSTKNISIGNEAGEIYTTNTIRRGV
ncbi:hypothetical protein JW877_06955 [bacterium]|nr:hypothetical protein [bacterium]